ncbi:Shewanella-like protein phosphatase [Thalictrum thalictroides]|uniref:Shewanella-like protein phosphatase n=1 Tax=Thalictrum thalictroides TaxID=46969 RepID=A0A7J6VRG2_THATH|nr:Shewanella-like protein phosphatase [Thalictrum thalictroides]
MEVENKNTSSFSTICADLPNHLSNFIDTFVDFTVSGGLFLLPPPSQEQQLPIPLTRCPSPPNRLVAIGDLHGDLDKSKQALRIAGLIDPLTDRWIGGDTTVVQIGDVLDRGGDELKILYFLEKLKREAFRCGGSIITMIGNHEIMNIDGDFRYITPSGLHEFKAWADWFQIGIAMKNLCGGSMENNMFQGIPFTFPRMRKEFHEGMRARIAALRPNGPISTRFLSGNPTALVVGDSVFVHGGLLQDHVSYGLERINEEVRDWINGLKGRVSPHFVRGRNSVVWLRKFSGQGVVMDCLSLLHEKNTLLGKKKINLIHHFLEFQIHAGLTEKFIRDHCELTCSCPSVLPDFYSIGRNTKNVFIGWGNRCGRLGVSDGSLYFSQMTETGRSHEVIVFVYPYFLPAWPTCVSGIKNTS